MSGSSGPLPLPRRVDLGLVAGVALSAAALLPFSRAAFDPTLLRDRLVVVLVWIGVAVGVSTLRRPIAMRLRISVALVVLSALLAVARSADPPELALRSAVDRIGPVLLVPLLASLDPAVGGRAIGGFAFVASLIVAGAIGNAFGIDPTGLGLGSTRDGRVAGALGHPGLLGSFLLVAIPVLVLRSIEAIRRSRRIAWGLVAGLAGVALVLSRSRSAWLAAALVFPAVVLLAVPRRRWLPWLPAIGVAVALAVSLLSEGPIASRLASTSKSDPTVASRLEMWRASLSIAAESPILGGGTGAFARRFPALRSPDYPVVQPNRNVFDELPHSEYLTLLAEEGILGLAATLLLVGLVLVPALRSIARERRPEATALVASAAAFLVDQASSVSSRSPAVALFFWGSLGLLAGREVESPPATGERRGALLRPIAAAFATAVALFAATSGLARFRASRELFDGVRLARSGDPLAATAALSRAEAFDRFDPRPPYLLATLALEQPELARRGDASRAAARVAALRHDFLLLPLLEGKAALAEGRLADAEKRLRRMVALDPGLPDAHYSLGVALGRLLRVDEAEASFRKAVELDPRHVPALSALAELAAERGDATMAGHWRNEAERAAGAR